MSNSYLTSLGMAGTTILLLITGCGHDGPQRAPVIGTITFDGKPLAKANVVFAPESGERSASGITDAEGHFQLGTLSINDGAIVGNHQVTITLRGPRRLPPEGTPGRGLPGGPSFPGLPLIPERYFNVDTSELTAVVENRRRNEIHFELSSAETP